MIEAAVREDASDDSDGKHEQPVDNLVRTTHTINRPDWRLDYDAITGTKFSGHKPKAEVFVTSYVAVGADTSRPVVFAFNGGPGSSSVWLHLGLFNPRRVLAGDVDHPQQAPYGITDNPETLLRYADLAWRTGE